MIGSCLEIVLALVAILPQTSTDVFFDSVGSIDGDSLFRCNSKATFICWASSDSVTFWVNETKAVECVFNCLPNKNVPGNYTFHHTAANLTIAAEVDNIGITEMKTTFECSSQNFPIRTKKPKVIIYPTNSSTNISTKDVESAVEIKVTTGCILPRNILSFVWDLTKKSDGTVLKPVSIQDLNFTENINQTDNSLCLPSANCGGNGVSTTLRFKPGNAGEDYLIQCTIIVNENVNGRAYNNFTIISDRTFQFIVPVLHVNLTTNITSLREEKGSVEENSTIQIQCITSYSRPRPEIILHGFSDIDILSPNCIQEYDTDGLIRTRCTYILKVTRKCDKSTLYCNATNMQHSVAVKSKPVTLNILYPPDGPPVIQNNVPGAVFTVIEFTKVVLTCTISNSNPGTNLTWICENNRATHFESNRNEISANISWTAERYQNTSCTCNAVYGLLTPWRTTINVDTLFPASITHLYLNGSQHTTIIQTIDVIENSTLMVKWDVEGNPIPNSYWLNASENSAEITFANVQRSLNGQVYEFRASNFMKPTTGNEQPGNDKKTVTLYVLYPPKIRPLRNISIIENRTLSQLCEIADGNPAAVTYYWTRMKKNEKNLTITNVNRSDQNWYQCRVNNTMMPTYGVVMYGEDVGQFYLHILYPPEDIQINSTSSPNHEVIDVIGVIENTELKLFCVAKGRPLPTNYSWSGIYASTTAEVNILGNRTKSGSLKCSVSNMMTELPNNKTEIGKGSKTVRINILYPPSIEEDRITNINATEGQNVHEPCLLDFGVTTDLTVYWLMKNGSTRYMKELSIPSVMTNDTGYYICLINYTLVPTFGSSILNGSLLKRFFLVVQQKAGTSEESKAGPNNNVGAIAGGLVGGALFVSIVIIGIAIIIRKRRLTSDATDYAKHHEYVNIAFNQESNDEKRDKRLPPLPPPKEDNNDIEIPTTSDISYEPDEVTYLNTAELIDNIKKIRISELFSYVSNKRYDDFLEEYEKLPKGLIATIPCSFARRSENAPLNRYQGIYPYDHCRVTVSGKPEFFINANYIDGFKRSRYIASLGPTLRHTHGFITFWDMVWHEESDIIVMLTNLVEPSGMKCEKYWVDYGTNREIGDFVLQSQAEEVSAEYTVRTFTVSKDDETRLITQLHYTAWPDKTVPESVISLIEFRQRVKATPTKSLGPLIVHCSAGIGRTGTYIALDRLVEEGRTTDAVNVYDCIMNMRKQRVNMVQTPEQYVYLHQALVYCLTFDIEPLSVEEIEDYIKTTSNNVYSQLYQQLKQTVEKDSTDEIEAQVRNSELVDFNRRRADIPGDAHRVRLYFDKEMGESDYINAVYLGGFLRLEHFIIAQSPLPRTVDAFVAMLYQEKCCCVVSLDDYQQKKTNNATYLPDVNQQSTYGYFTIACPSVEVKSTYIIRKLKIGHAGKFETGERIAFHFEFTGWKHDEGLPKDPKMFVEFVREVEEQTNQLADEQSHVVVHCMNGSERSGLFCAVSNLIEKIDLERQVSIANTLRRVRERRKTAIPTMEQLKFCYHAVNAFAKINKDTSKK